MPGVLKHNRRDEFAKKIVIAFFAMALVFSAALGSFVPIANAQENDRQTSPMVTRPVQTINDGVDDDGARQINGLDQIGLWLGNMLLAVGGLVAFMGGSLLDLSITMLILEMGKWLTEGGIGLVINATWSIVRDVVNLIFIFGFVYIGIMTILDPGRLNTRSLLVQLIIAALLINFSLFFTKIVVDVANVFALEVNQLMDRGEGGDIGSTFASEMGLSSMYRNQHPDDLAQLTLGGSITFFLMGTIFLIITGFVFAAGAVMIVIRFVALIFIMIGSPLFFAGMAFPQAKKFTFDILGKLLGYAFYAPVFLFLIYISLRVVQATTFGGGPDQFVNAMSGDGPKELNEFAIFLQFAVAIVLIIASLRVAKSFSMVGANAVVNTTEGAMRKIGRGVGQGMWNGASWLPKTGIGAASKAALSAYDKADASLSQTRRGRFARFAATALTLGTLSDRNVRGTLEAGQKMKLGGSHSYADDVAYGEARRKRQTGTNAAMKREAQINTAIKAGTDATPNQMKDMVDAIKNLTTDQLKDMDVKVLTDSKVAVHISTKQIEELEKTGKYSDGQIAEIKKARKEGIEAIANNMGRIGETMVGGQTLQETLAQRGVDEVAKMPIAVFTSESMAPYLTPAMLEAKMRSGISTEELDNIRTSLNRYVNNPDTPTRNIRQWENWQDRTAFGARVGLTFPRDY